MIGILLGHTQVQTTVLYAHLAAEPVKAAADYVAETLGRALGRLHGKRLFSIETANILGYLCKETRNCACLVTVLVVQREFAVTPENRILGGVSSVGSSFCCFGRAK